MGKRAVVVANQRFGPWIVSNEVESTRTKAGVRRRVFIVRSECCGTEAQMRLNSLQKMTGGTQCHACYQAKLREHPLSQTHGASKERDARRPTYLIWCAMRRRCSDAGLHNYVNYGGRGITVCDRWKGSFEDFMEDMGLRPSSKHSIDRINNDGNYCPENCRWATRKEQNLNSRHNRLIEAFGKTKPVSVWAEESGLPYSAIAQRLRRGWAAERAVSAPVHIAVQRCFAKKVES